MRNTFIIPDIPKATPDMVIPLTDTTTATAICKHGYRLATREEVLESGLLNAWTSQTKTSSGR